MKLCALIYKKIHLMHKDLHRLFVDNIVHNVDNSAYYPCKGALGAVLLFTDCNIRAAA